MKRIAIVGAGAAGMCAAYFALESGLNVTLFEKNRQPGRKICITGKGRCNLTNNCEARDFLANVVQGSKFLSSAIYKFPPARTMEWFESLGLALKTERGNRVFPQSERASDVRDVLFKTLKRYEHFSLISKPVSGITKQAENRLRVQYTGGFFDFDAVILATGGKSYPLTGSTGDGYAFARALGHTVTPLFPSLVRIVCKDVICADAEGLSLKNVKLSLFDSKAKKPLFSELGEMVFTSDGISGPLVLSASAGLRNAQWPCRLEIDFKPALSEEVLDARLLRDFAKQTNRTFKNSLDELLPCAMRPIFAELSGIDPEKRVHQITKAERAKLLFLFKHFPLTAVSAGPLEEAVVTAGGVALSEIDPHTMRSRICSNLYFAGEVMDVDALTGGFNLQIAFSTGKLAAESVAREVF